MSKKNIVFLIFFVLIFPLVSTASVCPSTGVASTDLAQCVNKIYTIALGTSAILALLMMILGGYYRMTSAGNAERASKGTDIIMSSIMGVVLLFGSYLLLRTINPDFVNFQLKSFDSYVPATTTPRGTP